MADAEENSMLNARMIIIGLTAALITVGALAAYLVLNTDEGSEPVILRADAEPYKVKPADRGGKKLDNLDSPMMDRLNSNGGEDDAGVEVLLPPEEEPELPPISVDPDPEVIAEAPETQQSEPETNQENVSVDDPKTEVITSESSVEETTETSEETAPAAPDTQTDQAEETAQNAEPETTQEPETVTAQAETETQVEPVESIDDAVNAVSKPEPKPASKTVLATGENAFYVQFAAFRSEKSARETAALLTTKHAPRLDGMILGFMRKGEYWRVVSDPLPREDAASLCRVFVSVGQDCIVKSLD